MNSAKKKIAVLTGAGVSAESGLSTFRGNNGLWGEYDPEEVASIQGWYRNRELVLNFYNGLRKRLSEVKPNAAHYAIADLEKEYSVTVITQNVDNLHEKAGSAHVIHLHGELTKVCSSRNPDDPRYIRDLPADDCEVKPGTMAGDGSLLRPYIVFFGESVPMISVAAEQVMKADVFVIIGTSLNVYPAAGLVQYVRPGVPVYLIDPEPVVGSGIRGVRHIQAGASEGMRQLVKELESVG